MPKNYNGEILFRSVDHRLTKYCYQMLPYRTQNCSVPFEITDYPGYQIVDFTWRSHEFRRRRQQLLYACQAFTSQAPLLSLTFSQAITEMTRQLRQGKGRTGLILANGGVMSYQHVLCLSTSARRDGSPYPAKNPLPEWVTDLPVPTVDAKVEGNEEATIEVTSPSP